MENSRIIKNILKEYYKAQQIAYKKKQERKEEVYEAIPRLREIDNELANVSLEITKSLLNKNNDYERKKLINSLKNKNYNLQNEKKHLYENSGIPEDYIENIYNCNKCKDTGYINNEKCDCFKQKIINEYYDLSGIKEVLQEENFDHFNFEYFSEERDNENKISPKENIKYIYKFCKQFTKEFQNKNRSILFYGHSGRGKTFLCNCIAKELLDQSIPVLYTTASNLFQTVENFRFNRDKFEDLCEKIEMFYSINLLIIDDLGTEGINSISQAELFNIINLRLIKKLPTIISTNLSLEDLQNTYSNRILSRIAGEYTILYFFGNDIRAKKKYTKTLF